MAHVTTTHLVPVALVLLDDVAVLPAVGDAALAVPLVVLPLAVVLVAVGVDVRALQAATATTTTGTTETMETTS